MGLDLLLETKNQIIANTQIINANFDDQEANQTRYIDSMNAEYEVEFIPLYNRKRDLEKSYASQIKRLQINWHVAYNNHKKLKEQCDMNVNVNQLSARCQQQLKIYEDKMRAISTQIRIAKRNFKRQLAGIQTEMDELEDKKNAKINAANDRIQEIMDNKKIELDKLMNAWKKFHQVAKEEIANIRQQEQNQTQ